MKRIFLAVLVCMLLMATVLAVKPAGTPASDARHLYLYEKDPTTWNIVKDGAWGKMMYQKDKFVFNGHGLEARKDYSLIYYPDFNNKYTLDFSLGGSIYSHTMIVDAFDKNGFTGHGYYNADSSYTWTVTGTSKDTFKIVYTGSNAGYTVDCIDGACTGPGQTFTLTVTDTGSAVWPHPIEILSTGITNGGGNVNIGDNFDFTSLPWGVDTNEGAKIWLVKSGDIVNGKLSGWNPTEYLFEANLI